MRRIGLSLILSTVACCGGCSSDKPDMASVAGQVLIDGQPLSHGTIQFVPEKSRASYGQLDGDGRFQLTCRDPNDGAVLGQHAVSVNGSEILKSTNFVTQTRWHAPKKYANPNTSGLKADITEPIDDLKFELSWGDGKPFVETETMSPEPAEAGRRIEE